MTIGFEAKIGGIKEEFLRNSMGKNCLLSETSIGRQMWRICSQFLG
jgi:hypothetical protein